MSTPIRYVEYNEKKYAVRIGYLALLQFKKDTGLSFEKSMSSDPDIENFEPLLWAALCAGAKVTQTELDIKREDMPIVLDECFMDFVAMIPDFFPEGKTQPGPPATMKKRK
jgi:hypothetical protein